MRALAVVMTLFAASEALAQKEDETWTLAPGDVELVTHAAAQKTDRYRNRDGTPQTQLVILRRNQSFKAVVSGGKWLGGPIRGASAARTADITTTDAKTRRETATAELHVAADAAVGRTKLVLSSGDRVVWSMPAVILFELPDERELSDRNDFLLKETGAVWLGTREAPLARPWAYNQFDMGVLSSALDAIDTLDEKSRREPVLVMRALGGQTQKVLRGRWDGDYKDGRSPGYWSSSTQILNEYRKNGVVKYGQSMVYACLLTSYARTMGIPATSTTGYDFVRETGADLVWIPDASGVYSASPKGQARNLHVWTEAWLKRPDLKGGDGWQAIDATPQESSSGGDRVAGPVSVALLAKDTKYDNAFVGGESNANLRHIEVGSVLSSESVPFYTVTVERVAVAGGTSLAFPIDRTSAYTLPKEPVQNAVSLDVAFPAFFESEVVGTIALKGEKLEGPKLETQVSIEPVDEATGRAVGKRVPCSTSGGGTGTYSAVCKTNLARSYSSAGARVWVVVISNGTLVAAASRELLGEGPDVALREAGDNIIVKVGRRKSSVAKATLTLAGPGVDQTIDLGTLLPGEPVAIEAPASVLAGARGRVAAIVTSEEFGTVPLNASFLRLDAE